MECFIELNEPFQFRMSIFYNLCEMFLALKINKHQAKPFLKAKPYHQSCLYVQIVKTFVKIMSQI